MKIVLACVLLGISLTMGTAEYERLRKLPVADYCKLPWMQIATD